MFLDELVGSLSQGAAGNPTVAVMEAAFRAADVRWRYVNVDVDAASLGDAVRGARAMGWRGFNVSMPHKRSVIAHLDGLDRTAGMIGAVNCVVRDGQRLIGTNTDGQGFVQSLRRVVDPAGAHAIVFGAGGAARAVAVELAVAGCSQVTVANRHVDAAADLARTITESTGVMSDARALGDAAIGSHHDIVVNATSVGLHTEEMLPLAFDALRPGAVVADVVFDPVDTAWLKAAASAGATTVDGLGMLVDQAAEALRRWAGIEPDLTVMRETLVASLSRLAATRD